MRRPLPVEAAEAETSHADPLAEAIRRADLVAIWAAIEALPRQQRDAIVLREFGGLSYGELAAALSVTPPAVESLLFRARRQLRAQLEALVASVSGAPLLEALARGFAGGVPIAAKVAALGVGAAAITGGAVVAPDVLERSHRSLPPARQPAPKRPPAVRRTVAPPAAAAPVPTATLAVAPAAHSGRHETDHHGGGSAPEHSAPGDSASGATSDGRDGASRETQDGGAAAVVQVSTDSSTSGGERSGRDGGDGGGSSDGGVSGEDG